MSDKIELLTPVGRLVMGDCFKGNTTDAEGNALVIKSGPNAGQPRTDYYMGLAIPKNDPGWSELWGKIQQAAKTGFPNLFDAAGQCINPAFAFKVTDGDSQIPNTRGNKPCDREGFPGHWILHFSGGFAPKSYTAGGKELITDPNALKRGYYIRIYGSVVGNQSMQQPGIYLNHSMVELIGYGEEISTGPSGDAVFGGTPAGALPAGASATPIAPATPMASGPGPAMAAPVAPVATQPGAPVPMAPGPATVAPTAPGAPVAAQPGGGPGAPATDYLNPAVTTAPAPAPPPPPVVVAVQSYNVNGQVFTRDALIAAGYNDQQLAALPLA